MAISEELIASVLQLLPKHSTIEGLKETNALANVPVADIYTALHILSERGQVRAGELFGRDTPLQSE